MLKYGNEYLEQDKVALDVLRDSMFDAAIALAEQMAI